MNSRNIYLIGFMGAGKSTVAEFLCRNYHMEQVEMDEQIQQEQNMTISRIFEEKGEEYFRKLETDLLERLSLQSSTVVSCGGGTAMRDCNVEIMKRNGKVVWLCAEPETVYERVKDCHDRPLLEGNMNVEYIRTLLEKRTPRYEGAADFCVKTDGRSAGQICDEIMEKMKEA